MAFICEEIRPPAPFLCKGCGSDLPKIFSRGRPKIFCSDECGKVWRRSNPRRSVVNGLAEVECSECGAAFQFAIKDRAGRWPKVCSPACSEIRHKRWDAETRAAYLALNGRARPSTVYNKACEVCGDSFATSYKRGKTCGKECAAISASRTLLARGKGLRTCELCGKSFRPFRLGQQQRIQGYVQKRCSKNCSPQLPAGRQISSRRHIHAGKFYEPVNPIKVFERDRWRCQLCGVRTPKRLRGSTDERAPELDHIDPISKGGEHSYRNTHCACRKCNGDKGAAPLGQLRLIG